MYEKALVALGNPVRVTDHITAVHFESRGKIPSPFSGDGLFPKGEVDLEEDGTGRKATITALSIYLIEKHGFFQGKGSRYRLEPGEIVSMLRLDKADF